MPEQRVKPRKPYGLAWKIALCRAVLAGDMVSAVMDVNLAQRESTTTFVFQHDAVRRWRL